MDLGTPREGLGADPQPPQPHPHITTMATVER
jgi:hypothetical protein